MELVVPNCPIESRGFIFLDFCKPLCSTYWIALTKGHGIVPISLRYRREFTLPLNLKGRKDKRSYSHAKRIANCFVPAVT